MEFAVYKYITNANLEEQVSACDVVIPPELVAKATGVCVVPADYQRRKQKS